MRDPEDQKVPQDVVDVLVGRVAELERSQREEDAEGFLALFASTAVWVTGGGRRLIGLEEISAFTRSVLPGAFAEGSVDYDVEHISAIAPGVVLTGCAAGVPGRRGPGHVAGPSVLRLEVRRRQLVHRRGPEHSGPR